MRPPLQCWALLDDALQELLACVQRSRDLDAPTFGKAFEAVRKFSEYVNDSEECETP